MPYPTLFRSHPACGDQQSADCTVATRSAPPAPPGTPQSGQSRVPRPTEPFVPLLHKLHVPTRGMRGHLTPHRTRLILEQVHPDERRIHPTRHRLERLDQRTRVLGLGKAGRKLPPRRGSDLTHRGPVPVVPFDLQTERLLRKMDRLPDNLHPPPEAKSLPVTEQLPALPAASTCHQLLHDPRRTQRIIMTPRKQLLIPLRMLGRQCPLNHIRPRQRPTGEQLPKDPAPLRNQRENPSSSAPILRLEDRRPLRSNQPPQRRRPLQQVRDTNPRHLPQPAPRHLVVELENRMVRATLTYSSLHEFLVAKHSGSFQRALQLLATAKETPDGVESSAASAGHDVPDTPCGRQPAAAGAPPTGPGTRSSSDSFVTTSQGGFCGDTASCPRSGPGLAYAPQQQANCRSRCGRPVSNRPHHADALWHTPRCGRCNASGSPTGVSWRPATPSPPWAFQHAPPTWCCAAPRFRPWPSTFPTTADQPSHRNRRPRGTRLWWLPTRQHGRNTIPGSVAGCTPAHENPVLESSAPAHHPPPKHVGPGRSA